MAGVQQIPERMRPVHYDGVRIPKFVSFINALMATRTTFSAKIEEGCEDGDEDVSLWDVLLRLDRGSVK